MSDRFKSRAAVRDKVEWEGGIVSALDYGIKVSDMPEGDTELTEAWTNLEVAWRVLRPLAEAVDKLIDVPGDDEDDGDE